MYKRDYRRLLASVQALLPGEQVEDVAVAHPWSSLWPSLAGGAVLLTGGIYAFDERMVLLVTTLVLGFALLILGWLASRATLIVTTADEVVLVDGRRRTYQPAAVQERLPRSSSLIREELRERRLFVPTAWRKHLPVT
ncbi:MAG: hypothetical protein KY450_13240 [Actinobacteria bacterium]|nr:hypothetical protein [Actinomycetota bacterium]